MSETTQVIGNHSMEFLEPTWLRVNFPYPEQLPSPQDIIVPQNIAFNDRKSHWAYNAERLGPFTQHSGPPPAYHDQPLLVQYHPLYRLFDDDGAYIHDTEAILECEHTVEAVTFEQQSLWQAYERPADDGTLVLAYQAIMQLLRTPDGGWVHSHWIGNIAPGVKNMGWMIGGLALGDSIIGPDAVLRSGKIANSRLHGKSVVDTKAGIVAHSTLEQATVQDMSEVRHSSLYGATVTNASLSNIVCRGAITIQDVRLSDVSIFGQGVIGRGGIEGDISMEPLARTRSLVPVTAFGTSI